MFQLFAIFRRTTASRRGLAVLLAFWLNLAAIPCAMALESSEPAHDCCPPELQVEPLECCTLDDVLTGSRVQHDLPDQEFAPLPQPVIAGIVPGRSDIVKARPPPGRSGYPPPVFLANCVFLK